MSVDDISGISGTVSIVALVDGAPQVHRAVVVARDQAVLRLDTSETPALSVGSVVGVLQGHGHAATSDDPGVVSLALVSDTVGDHTAELRMLERRA